MIRNVFGKLSRRERRAQEKPVRSQRATALLRLWKHRITRTATISSLLLALSGSPLLAETGFVKEAGPWEKTPSIFSDEVKPAFADLDGDEDLDAFVGGNPSSNDRGYINYYKNAGSSDSPTFNQKSFRKNPLGSSIHFEYGLTAPILVDIDGDGDQDAFIGYSNFGRSEGKIRFWENTGDSSSTTAPFIEHIGDDNPLSGVDNLYYSVRAAFADLDGDGDLDVFFGDNDGTIKYYRNDAGTFSEQAADNTFSGVDVGQYSAPAFTDLDGDLDAFIGQSEGGSLIGENDSTIRYYRNTNNAPTDINLSGGSVDENQVSGTIGGTLSAMDADGSDNFTFTLVAGTGDSDNSSFSISGDTLNTAAVLSAGSKSVRIRVTDNSGGYYEEAFTITVNDLTAPTFGAGYPASSNIGGTGFTLTTQLDEPGTAYYVILSDGADVPTPAEVLAGTGSAGAGVEASGSIAVDATDTSFSATVTDLTSETAYDIYLVAEDDESSPNAQSSVTQLEVATADVTTPDFASGYPKAENVTENSLDMAVQLDEIGTAHYVLLADGATAPTAVEVKAGTGSAGETATESGSIDVTAADTDTMASLTGLEEATA